MVDQTTRFDAVKHNYNELEYEYEVRRLEVESPAEHFLYVGRKQGNHE